MQMTDYRAGQQFYAGMGVSTILPDCDFETFSQAGFLWNFAENKWKKPEGAPPQKKGLEIVGGGNYACDPTAEVLSFKYDLKDGRGPQWWKPGLPNPVDLFAWIAAGGLLEAHYSTFEHWCWEHICVPKYGWPHLPLEQLRCSMAKSRAHALPGKLAEVGAVLNIVNQKDPIGKRLIDKFTMPRNPTKKDPRLRIRPEEDFEGPLFYQYNERDIVAESEVSIRVPDLSPMELRYWLQDQRINYRGIQIDEEAVDNCIAIVNTAIEQYGLELEALAGCKPSELQQLKGWLHAHGVHLDSMDEEAIEEALTREGLPPQCRRALEIRAAVGSASVKKVYSMRLQALKGRLHDLYTFFGARTGRPTGNGPQPTNLPKAGPNVYRCGYLSNREPSPTGGCGRWHGGHTFFCPWCKKPRGPDKASEWNPGAVEDALLIISGRSLWLLQEYFGDAMLTIAGVLRGLFIAKPGCDLISSDFTAIEGVVIAELAGETWRTEVYAGHGLMYLESASRAFGVPLQELIDYATTQKQHHPLRDKGKRLELACFSPQTQVLTDKGYLAMVDVSTEHKLWDGVEWVSHAGVIARGSQRVISLDGVEMTPTHKVLCETSWLEAQQLASNGNTLSRALVTGSANLSSLMLSPAEETRKSSFAARVVHRCTSWLSRTFGSAQRHVAGSALTKLLSLRGTPSTKPHVLTTTIESVSLTDSLARYVAATASRIQTMRITVRAAFRSTPRGALIELYSSRMWSLCLVGMTRHSILTAKRPTAITHPETFDLSRVERTASIDAQSGSFRSGSTTLKPVFDIAHAGPRNRFTIKTDSGHLIVHNCGFGGWISALRNKQIDYPGTDDELKAAILKWRAASPNLVEFWGGQSRNFELCEPFGLEGAALRAIQYPGTEFLVYRLNGTWSGISYVMQGDALYCKVPSGGLITYHEPRLTDSGNWRGMQISYSGWNTNPKQGAPGWVRMSLYSGKCAENVTQRVARDIQMHALASLEDHGYPIVMHTYDEFVAEVPLGFGSIEEAEQIACDVPPWAKGWPIKQAGGWRGHRYRKA